MLHGTVLAATSHVLRVSIFTARKRESNKAERERKRYEEGDLDVSLDCVMLQSVRACSTIEAYFWFFSRRAVCKAAEARAARLAAHYHSRRGHQASCATTTIPL